MTYVLYLLHFYCSWLTKDFANKFNPTNHQELEYESGCGWHSGKGWQSNQGEPLYGLCAEGVWEHKQQNLEKQEQAEQPETGLGLVEENAKPRSNNADCMWSILNFSAD